MVATGAIVKGLLTAVDIAKAVKDVSDVIPDAPRALQEKHRWLTMTVFNKTQFQLIFKGENHFNSGRFWTAPTTVPPFSKEMFSGCNKDNSFATGVSGATLFELDLNGDQNFPIAVGFSNPQFGSLKASVAASILPGLAIPLVAYGQLTDESMRVEHTFKGENVEGKRQDIKIIVTSAPGQEGSVTISEEVVRVYGEDE